MKKLIIFLCALFLIEQVQPKRIKICIPKKNKPDLELAHISFDKLFEKLKEESDAITIHGNYSMKLNLEGLIDGNVSASDITISGYKNISTAILPDFFTAYRITLNAITLHAENYKIYGAISDLFDLYGDGKLDIYLENISINVVDLIPWIPLGCFKVNLKMKLQKMKANFENLLDGDPTVNKVINQIIGDLGPDVIDYYWPGIYESIEPLIQEIIDKYVNKQELGNLLSLLVEGRNNIPTMYINKEFSP